MRLSAQRVRHSPELFEPKAIQEIKYFKDPDCLGEPLEHEDAWIVGLISELPGNFAGGVSLVANQLPQLE
jgi:hypothetical protein